MQVSYQLRASAILSPGKEPTAPIGQEGGWAPEPVWTHNTFKNARSYTSPSSYVCKVWYLAKHRYNFTSLALRTALLMKDKEYQLVLA